MTREEENENLREAYEDYVVCNWDMLPEKGKEYTREYWYGLLQLSIFRRAEEAVAPELDVNAHKAKFLDKCIAENLLKPGVEYHALQ
jgi:hypothetical protein